MGSGPPKQSMGRGQKAPRFFYYAAGKRVTLTPDEDLVAIDQERAGSAKISEAARARIKDRSKALRGNVVLVAREELPSAERDALRTAMALQPVFCAEGATIVALPEVRVEDSSPQRLKALRAWLDKHRDIREHAIAVLELAKSVLLAKAVAA